MKEKSVAVQDIYLEQAAVDELPSETLRILEEQPGFSRQAFDRKVDALRTANQAFHKRFDRKEMLDSIREKAFSGELSPERESAFAVDIKSEAPASRRSEKAAGSTDSIRSGKFRRWSLAIAAALPLIFIAAFVLRMAIPTAAPVQDGLMDGIRTKGLEPKIFIYRDLGNGNVELLHENDIARENDKLQISYLATGQNYGAIISIDGSSVITLHYPANSNMLPRLQPTDEVYLPYGYRLDDAPSFEDFFFITSNEAFDVRELIASLAPQLKDRNWIDRGELTFPDGFKVSRIDLSKAPRDR